MEDDWDNDMPHYSYAPAEDPAHLNDAALTACGRTTSLQFWDHHTNGQCVHHTIQLANGLEMTAMPLNQNIKLDIPTAQRGMHLMLLHGADLMTLLKEGGLLYEYVGLDGIPRDLTKQKRVRDLFVDIAYVITCRDAAALAGFRNPTRASFCTCI